MKELLKKSKYIYKKVITSKWFICAMGILVVVQSTSVISDACATLFYEEPIPNGFKH